MLSLPQLSENLGPFSFELDAGVLTLDLKRSEMPLSELLMVGQRLNPKRPFIFVSKVLGKHYPVKPSLMALTHSRLASLLGAVPGPRLFVAMAETAIGLGRGVFEAYSRLAGSQDSLFIHTTRYKLNSALALKLDEPHSHARDHLLYEPAGPGALKLFRSFKSLVVIDDEVSTGRTFANLAKALKSLNSRLESLFLVTLASFLTEESKRAISEEVRLPLKVASLLEGVYSFEAKGEPKPTPAFNSVGRFEPKDQLLSKNFGRLGLTFDESLALTEEASFLGRDFLFPQRGPVRVLGTGEFVHEPFALALALEKRGLSVRFQSTTRTPMALGSAVSSRLSFEDNYGEGLDNFIYNLDPFFNGHTLIVYEAGGHNHSLTKTLSATAVSL
ncbi:MAG: phosphoribosyltransferase family protein [Deltaproteobacteria bacterium]|jgi:hypothetical protein|nr:phosphoribosyltransferase family protein [Deltaproteobacteria bacterium]